MTQTKLMTLATLSANNVTETDPWTKTIPLPKFKDRMTWRSAPTTQWYFHSGYAGEEKHARVSSHNPPAELRAFIVDWDCPGGFTEDDISKFKVRVAKQPIRPAVIHRTPGGGIHAIFLLDKPISVDSKLAANLQKRAAKEMGLSSLLPGFDRKAFLKPEQYYMYWPEGINIDTTATVPSNVVVAWKADCLSKMDYEGEASSLDLDVVFAEVEQQFPGKWTGPFGEGAQGVRFWDAQADNPKGAWVKSNGVVCFTGPVPFMSWSAILGRKFVDSLTQARFGAAVAGIYYDGTGYQQDTGKGWFKKPERVIMRQLTVRGLSTEVLKGEEMSELSRAMNFIEEQQMVFGTVPMVYQDALVDHEGQKKLNSSRVRALEPGTSGEFSEFPVAGAFIETFFTNEVAKDYFLAWLQRTYAAALALKPVMGQCMVIAGPPGCGKSFLARRIVGPLLGGYAPADDYVMGVTRFNDNILDSGLAVIDDGANLESGVALAKYTQRIKKLVASPTHIVEAKFMRGERVDWRGRVMIMANDDSESLKSIPDCTANSEDKIMMIRVQMPMGGKGLPEGAEDRVKKEMPSVARWLLDWEIPDHVVRETRFGIKAHHDEGLLEEARSASFGSALGEVIDMWFQDELNRSKRLLQGTASEILGELMDNEVTKPLAGEWKAKNFGMDLSKMVNRAKGKVEKVMKHQQGYYYVCRIFSEDTTVAKERARIKGEVPPSGLLKGASGGRI